MANCEELNSLSDGDISIALAAAERYGIEPELALKAVHEHFDPASAAAANEPIRPRSASGFEKLAGGLVGVALGVLVLIVVAVSVLLPDCFLGC